MRRSRRSRAVSSRIAGRSAGDDEQAVGLGVRVRKLRLQHHAEVVRRRDGDAGEALEHLVESPFLRLDVDGPRLARQVSVGRDADAEAALREGRGERRGDHAEELHPFGVHPLPGVLHDADVEQQPHRGERGRIELVRVQGPSARGRSPVDRAERVSRPVEPRAAQGGRVARERALGGRLDQRVPGERLQVGDVQDLGQHHDLLPVLHSADDPRDAEGVARLELGRAELLQAALRAAHLVVAPDALVPAQRERLREPLRAPHARRRQGEPLRLDARRPFVGHPQPDERQQLGVGRRHGDLEAARPKGRRAGPATART